MLVGEKEQLAQTLMQIQQGKCFICEESIDLSLHKWQIDHIIPRAKGGKDDPNNLALTHEKCNRNKSDSDLRVARCMARYEKIKNRYADAGPSRPNLGDFLRENGAVHPDTHRQRPRFGAGAFRAFRGIGNSLLRGSQGVPAQGARKQAVSSLEVNPIAIVP